MRRPRRQHLNPNRRGRGWRAWRFGAAWFLAVAVLVGAAPPAPAGAQPGSVHQAGSAPRLTLRSQPAWVDPKMPTSVMLSVTGAPSGADVHAELHDRITERSQLHSSRPAEQTSSLCSGSGSRDAVSVSDLTPGRRSTVTVSVRLTTHPPQLPDGCQAGAGVYPLEVWVTDANGNRLGTPLVTYLLLNGPPSAASAGSPSGSTTDSGAAIGPGGSASAGDTASSDNSTTTASPTGAEPPAGLGVALVLPIGDQPTIGLDGRRALPDAVKQDVTTLLDVIDGPTGTFQNAPFPLTLAPVPDTVDTITVADRDMRSRLLRAARAARREVLVGPYIPVDQPALTTDPRLRDLLGEEIDSGRSALEDFTQADLLAGATWVADRDLDATAAGYLRDRGVRRMLIPDAALTPSRSSLTPTNAFNLANDPTGTMVGLALDSRLPGDLGGRDQRLGVQRTLADLALIARQSPGESQTQGEGVVLAAPPDWHPTASTLRTLLGALAQTPSTLRPVTVGELFTTPGAGQSTASRSLAGHPTPPARYVAALDQTNAAIASYRSTIAPTAAPGTASPEVTQRLSELNIRRKMSAYDGFPPATQERYLDAVQRSVAGDLARITVPDGQKITLTARTAKVPFTIRNGTGLPVDVVVMAEGSERVKFESAQEQTIHIDGESTRVDLRVHVRTSGDIPLRIQVLTPQGGTTIAQSRITVRSTVVSGVGLILTIGALLFLVIWWISHWRTNRRPPRGRHARAR